MKFMLYSPDQAYQEPLCVNVEIGGQIISASGFDGAV